MRMLRPWRVGGAGPRRGSWSRSVLRRASLSASLAAASGACSTEGDATQLARGGRFSEAEPAPRPLDTAAERDEVPEVDRSRLDAPRAPPLGTPKPPAAPPPPTATEGSPADALAPVCVASNEPVPPLVLTEVARGLEQPTFLAAPPGDAARLFVLERRGTIRIIDADGVRPEPFLDLSARVVARGDQGLIGLAFHPAFADDGRFYVSYASPRTGGTAEQTRLVVSELTLRAADAADAASERVLLTLEPPSSYHAGGMLAFGPADGLLYIGVGDGGSSRSRDLGSWLGKLLRIDVDERSSARPYGVPSGNAPGALPEVWSYGLRNPWRFSFDPCNGDLYLGDVGDDAREEVDFSPGGSPGRDYGWKVLEGTRCREASGSCDARTLTPPLFEYDRSFGCAVIGGYVYRGSRVPGLVGTYLFADYCSGRIASFRVSQGRLGSYRELTDELTPTPLAGVTSFGVDARGELYLLTLSGGVFRLEPK